MITFYLMDYVVYMKVQYWCKEGQCHIDLILLGQRQLFDLLDSDIERDVVMCLYVFVYRLL